MEMLVLIVAAPQKNGTVPNYSKQSEIREQLQLALMPVLAALVNIISIKVWEKLCFLHHLKTPEQPTEV